MLSLLNVVKRYQSGVVAVDDVSFHAPPGVLALIGHNGAGKTSLMNMIATLTKPTSGDILFNGDSIVSTPGAIRRRMGFLPQDFGGYPNLTALEFLQYFAAVKGVTDRRRVHDVLGMVNLHQQAASFTSTFSGGMRRRLGIAQALLNDPDILLVDEPTAGLDPEERLRFRHLLAELGFKKLVVISTHIVSDIENMAGQIAIMREGKLASYGTPDDLIRQARGQVWSATVTEPEYERLRCQVQVLHAQKNASGIQLRIAHRAMPCPHALAVEPSLDEALMSQRYALPEQAA